ncbi:hypothetical protein HY492_00230 [Candidatus Woesearchaeota archaeon]|nr:hypothetical protein [Candidatus Woesearchaeota archaeon]
MNKNIVGGIIVIGLLALLIGTVVFAGRSSSATGMATDGFASEDEMMAAHHPEQSSGMSNEGFSSQEEMMEAHHGGSAGASDGCGGVPASHDGVSATDGEPSSYGITYDSKGYDQLLKAAQSITLNAAQTKTIVGLNILLPCCGVSTLQAKDNCPCGHHVAMFGLAKMLATKGYERADIQTELNRWKTIFYPGGVDSGAGGC